MITGSERAEQLIGWDDASGFYMGQISKEKI